MSPNLPPRIASWMLERLMPNGCDEAIAGDLFESFRAGRSVNWYWRQVLAAVLLAWTRSVLLQWPSLIFAFAWAALAPGWALLITRLYHTSNLIGPIWRLPWPWSTVCYFGISIAESLIFIWTGVLIHLLLLGCTSGIGLRWQTGRRIVTSFAGFILGFLCAISIESILMPVVNRHAVNWRTLTLTGVITNVSFPLIMMRLPYVVATFCALWGAVPCHRGALKRVE